MELQKLTLAVKNTFKIQAAIDAESTSVECSKFSAEIQNYDEVWLNGKRGGTISHFGININSEVDGNQLSVRATFLQTGID